MRTGRSARIAGIEFVEWPLDHHGDWFVLDQAGIKSLWGGVDVRRDGVPRPASHGSFDLPGYLTTRVIPISGHVSSRSAEGLEHLQARLSGLLAGGGTGKLSLDGPLSSRWCSVRLASATQIEILDATTARFLVTFWAANPRLFGEVREFDSALPVFHRGNFPAIPELIVTGTMPSGYAVHGPDGRQFVVSQALAGGQTHRIDFRTGRVFLNDVLQVGAVSNGGVWTIPSGDSVAMSLVPVSGSGVLTVRVPDTFI